MEVDYIVIGAGAAGSVLARRLSDDPRRQVLLLEDGGSDRHPLLHVPKGFFYTLRGERYAHHYRTLPVGPGGQAESWTRGRVLGGSTSVNGMMWLRGAAADFDSLAARGNPGWGWDRALAAYRAMEDHDLGGSATRGSGGPLGVSVARGGEPVAEALLAAGGSLGWAVVEDVNDSDTERIGPTPSSIRDGVRSSAYRAFVHPVRERSNLTVLTRTRVGNLIVEDGRVRGVVARHRGGLVEHTARREVIVAAGTVETPLLLERSGIGRPEVLHAAGIALRVESPHVGERVVEQRGVALQVRLTHRHGPRLDTLTGRAAQALRYAATRSGPLATGGYDVTCQVRSSPGLARPDIQGIVVPMALDVTSESLRLAHHPGVLFLGYPLRPTTQGSVHVSGPTPEDPPVIAPRFLTDAAERAATASILDIGRRLLAQHPIGAMVRDEEMPGPAVSSPEDVIRYALDTGGGIFHAVGSAAMGPAADDVTDPALRVRGVEGLRIADASVLPVQLSGNSAAPTMVVGWLAADLVLADA